MKGQDYLYINRCTNYEDDSSSIKATIGKLDCEDVTSLHLDGWDFKETIKPQLPDLYDVFNKYVPQDIDVVDALLKFDKIKTHVYSKEAEPQQKAEDNSKMVMFIKSLDKWNSGK